MTITEPSIDELEAAISEISILDMSGDTKIKWDRNQPAEVENARRTFNDLKQRGYTAHASSGSTALTNFDPNAEKMVMVPPMVGG